MRLITGAIFISFCLLLLAPYVLVSADSGSQPSCTFCRTLLGCPRSQTVNVGQGIRWTWTASNPNALLNMQYTLSTNNGNGLMNFWMENARGCIVDNSYNANDTCSYQYGSYSDYKVSLVAFCVQSDDLGGTKTCTFRLWNSIYSTMGSPYITIEPTITKIFLSQNEYTESQCPTKSSTSLNGGAVAGIVIACVILFCVSLSCYFICFRRFMSRKGKATIPSAAPTVQASAPIAMSPTIAQDISFAPNANLPPPMYQSLYDHQMMQQQQQQQSPMGYYQGSPQPNNGQYQQYMSPPSMGSSPTMGGNMYPMQQQPYMNQPQNVQSNGSPANNAPSTYQDNNGTFAQPNYVMHN